MTLDEKTTAMVIEALAAQIRELKIDIILKNSEIENLRVELKEAQAELEEAQNGDKD